MKKYIVPLTDGDQRIQFEPSYLFLYLNYIHKIGGGHL